MSPDEDDTVDKQYEELKPRQQALVDVLAEDRLTEEEYTANELLEEAADRSNTDPYNRSYLYEFKRRYEEVIEERTQVLANEREEHDGAVEIEVGNSRYEGPEEGLDTTSGRGTQMIQDRPVKSAGGDERVTQPSEEPEGGVEVHHISPRLSVDLTDAEAFTIIRYGNREVAESVFYRLISDQLERPNSDTSNADACVGR